MQSLEVPVVDVSGIYTDSTIDRAAVAVEIGKAIDELGFFYVKGHRVSDAAIHDVLEASAEFFAMSDGEKMKYYVGHSKTHKGYVPEGEEDFGGGGAVDHKEALDIGMELGEEHPGVQELIPFHGHNMWPPERPTFRTRVVTYYEQVYELSRRLMESIALSLGLEKEAFDDHFSDPIATLRLIHYPGTPGEEGSIGISEHEDFECITILFSDAPGLELKMEDGAWLDVPPRPGAFIVNIGEMLEVLTNGRLKPRKHRVRAVSRPRLSLPFFLGCNYSTEMVPMIQFKNKGPFDEKYGGVSMGDHLWSAVMQTYRYLIDKVNSGEVQIPSGIKIRREEWLIN